MSEAGSTAIGPDFCGGVPFDSIADQGMLLGHAQGAPVLLARRGNELFALDAVCTHYGGPLAEGLLVGETVRCPWHHACFSLRSGQALRAPALNPLSCWQVEQRHGQVYVREKIAAAEAPSAPTLATSAALPKSVLIIGGGAAGNAAAETLRREGFTGSITLLSADSSIPYDRPNLSKGYLAGSAPAEWIPLRSMEFYREQDIDLRLGAEVASIDPVHRHVLLVDESEYSYDALLLATGAAPIQLQVPGAELPHVHTLRTLADSTALIAKAQTAQRAVIVGASFIGLEVAASLRARNLEVHVVGRESSLMEGVLGPQVGAFLRTLHEAHGVTFHLNTSAASIDAESVRLLNGDKLAADLVVVGIGVQPALELAQQAGLALDRGVMVDEYLATSIPGIFAAGDIARWPDRLSGEAIRVEHWVVAERQGQTAARNILGRRERFDAVPFFWTEQYDFTLGYTGHAAPWDQIDIDGSLEARDCTISYRRGGKKLAVAVVQRDLDGLRAELEFERSIAAKN